MKKFIFYDLDGTIVDTRQDIVLAARHMVREVNGTTISDEEVYGFVGKGIHYLLEGCLQTSDPKVVERGGKIYRDHYAKHMLDNTVLYPAALEVLNRFSDRKQAVVTNKPDPYATDILKALKVDAYFLAIVAGNSNFPKKPDPASVETLLSEEGIDPKDALFVGDSRIDYETGKNAGLETVIISHGFSSHEELKKMNPDFLINNLDELQALADEKGW